MGTITVAGAFRESVNNLLRSIGVRVEIFAAAEEFLSKER